MAFDLERESARHAAGWRGFVTGIMVSAMAVAAALLLMAVALL